MALNSSCVSEEGGELLIEGQADKNGREELHLA